MAKILIVEDNKTLNQVYTFILEKEGYQVSRAFDGDEGLQAAKKLEPEVILLDILMPKMDGITFLKKYYRSKPPETVVIILSNLDEDPEVEEARKLGAQDYILKATISPSELAAIVNKYVKKPPKKPKKK